ncbi:RHS repeat-associated core domain-containing protein [Sphingobacterium siyangense]|uniref:RHS repeat domain-containing protein n=1 Tax=Sphingobacterium siyangense TaxID=459529 RepID=UPI002FD89E13
MTRADVSGLVDASVGPLWETRSGADYPSPATTFPLAGPGITITPLIVNYYDDYTFTGATTLPASGITKSTMIKSLQTGSKVYRTDGTAPLLTVMYYDDYGRVIQSASKNHLDGTDYVTNTYNFPGELLTSTRVHTPATGAATTIVTSNAYDHVGRLISTKERIGSQAEVILASNSYNEIGQLKSKAVGKAGTETSFVNSTTYSYNERGWLSKSTSPKFSQELKYQDGTNPQWNGNISQQLWGDDATLPNTFSYQYDKLNRLTSGSNGQTGVASIAEVITYDDLGMGNIKTLKRDALVATTYTYTGNKLMSLSGGLTGSYTYDANGNAKTDRMGMAITYNYLNLPQTAKNTGTDVAFLYNAAGVKLQKLSKIGTAPNIITTTRDYVGGIEYNNGTIDIIHNSEGYAQRNGANYVYHYNLTDHLGNVRVTLKRGSSPTTVDVAQRDNYYPFGKRKVVAGGNNNYLYNGKEIQGELGDQYDYGARFYDAEIGRWNVIDPKAQLLETSSPYVYALNSPSSFIDKDGELPIYIGGKTNQDSERNSKTYWDAQILATIAGSGIPNPGNTALFIDGNRYLYDSGVKKEVRNATLLAGESEASRVRAGYQEGLRDFKRILSHLERDPKTGKITEKIQIYTHSRGAAFGAGYTEALLDMIKQNPDEFADAVNEIDFVYNMAPHGGANINSPRGVDAYAHHHDRDKLSENGMNGVLGDFSSNEKKEGFFGAHANGSFVKDLKVFLSVWQNNKGDSRKIISDFVNKMKALGIKVTVHQ